MLRGTGALVYFVATVLCFEACLASFRVEKGAVRVLFPPAAKTKIDMALANFGEPKYGAALSGQLAYPSTDPEYKNGPLNCGKISCNYVCSMLNSSTPPFYLHKEPGKHYVMLVDRGPRLDTTDPPCYFLHKVYYAQLAGADAVLVVNDQPGTELSTAVPPEEEEAARMLNDVTISAALISLEDGAKLKSLLRQGSVTVALNWTDLLPRAPSVSWEFWTNSNDECGSVCEQQQKFIKDMKPRAKALEEKHVASFSPHYLIWVCPAEFINTDACKTQCIKNGSYCCPDPDDDVHSGYKGSEVLMMNFRELCFFQVAKASGQPWLWWEYADFVAEQCKMKEGRYTKDCAEQGFVKLGGPGLANNQGWQLFNDCLRLDHLEDTSPIPMLDSELAAQSGTGNEGGVAILPTIRINAAQYRGSLDVQSLTRALCSAFPLGQEPTVCTEETVSENECKVGGEGWLQCNNGTNLVAGRTSCVNTFAGYSCECGLGYIRAVQNGTDMCVDINECLMTNIPLSQEDCSCSRCTCINLRAVEGGYRCSGPMAPKCTAEENYGGCWHAVLDGQVHHACIDNFDGYRVLAMQGNLAADTKTYRCECPACFEKTDDGQCKPSCDLKFCNYGVCSGASNARPGMSAAAVFFIILTCISATVLIMYAGYQLYLRQQMQQEVRHIMSEYMPLDSVEVPAQTVRAENV